MILKLFLLLISLTVKIQCLDDDYTVVPSELLIEFISKHPIVLIGFYKSGSNECEKFSSVFSNVSKSLKNTVVKVVRVEDVEPDLMTKYDIDDGLTIKYSLHGKLYHYNGLFIENHIISTMNTVFLVHRKAKESDKVFALTEKNFNDTIVQNNFVFIEFYSNTCKHCQQYAPSYRELANMASTKNPAMLIASIDCDKEQSLAKMFQLRKYPTFFLIQYRKELIYDGTRVPKGIIKWLEKQFDNTAFEVRSDKEFKSYKPPLKVSMIGVFKSFCSIQFNEYMEGGALLKTRMVSMFTRNADILSNFKLTNIHPNMNVIILMPEYLKNQYDPEYIEFKYNELDNVTSDSINKFGNKNIFPLIGEYNSFTKDLYNEYHGKKFFCTFFMSVDFSKHHRKATQQWIQILSHIVADYRNDIRFAIADDVKFVSELQLYGLGDTGEDINLGCVSKQGDRYGLEPHEFYKKHIKTFFDNLVGGKAWPFVKSKQAPNMDNVKNGYLGEIVGSTYKNLVNENPNKLLMMLWPNKRIRYSTWYEPAIQLLKNLSTVLYKFKIDIGFLDFTYNDLPMPIHSGLTKDDILTGGLYAVVNRTEDASKPIVLKKKFIKCDEFPEKQGSILNCVQSKLGVHITKEEL